MLHARRIALSLLSLAAVAATSILPRPGETVPVQLAANGSSAPDGTCTAANLSASARLVAFTSEATNLLPTDTDSVRDVVVTNLRKGTGVLASQSTDGAKANQACDDPVLDRGGKRVVFSSVATNLVDGDFNGLQDVFVRDLKAHTTVRASVASDGTEANGRSAQATISGNGAVVVFASLADNLVPDDTNGTFDVFAHDLRTGETRCVSAGLSGAPANAFSFAPAISASGRYVAFLSKAGDLGPEAAPGSLQAYVRDLAKGTVQLVSTGLDGALPDRDCHDITISANGRWVAFSSAATNLVGADAHLGWDIFLRDLKKHDTRMISTGLEGAAADADSRQATVSRNGKWVVFASDASNLVTGDANGSTDVFRWGLKTGVLDRVSISSTGEEGDGNSELPSVQRNGRYVSFSTRSTNLFQVGATDGTWCVALRCP